MRGYRKIDVAQAAAQTGGVQLFCKDGSINEVRFDIMVTSEATDNTGGSGGINVQNIVKIGGKKEVSSSDSAVNRIQFSVSYAPPKQVHYKSN